jgi:hypothetical protein
MKVYISKYRDHWISPYTICEKICFWREIDYDEPWVKRTNTVLEPVMQVVQKIWDFVHPRINYIKIDRYDTWNMDSTLSPIILPMLKQLRIEKHGAPYCDDVDVPEHLRSTTPEAQAAKENDWDTDGNHFKRWDWVMDEMIYAFEQLNKDDWEEPFYRDRTWLKEEWQKEEARIQHGLMLFGKYYRNLWD